jgi:hypothetical protein
MSFYNSIQRIAACAWFISLLGAIGLSQQLVTIPPLTPRPYHPALSDFRIATSEIIPETESAQDLVFSDAISAAPANEGIDKIVAPPLTTLLHQQIGLRDVATRQTYINGRASHGFQLISGPSAVWMPGKWTVSIHGALLSLTVEQIALHKPQGFVEVIVVKNESSTSRRVELFSIEQPSIARPDVWGYSPTFPVNQSADKCAFQDSVLIHENQNGGVAIASRGMSQYGSNSLTAMTSELLTGTAERQRGDMHCGVSAGLWRLNLTAGSQATVNVVITISSNSKQAAAEARAVLINPTKAVSEAIHSMQVDLNRWFDKLPALASPSPALSRFYYHAAAQLFYDCWRLGKTFLLNPWYPVSGRDSGGMNLYAWDVQYAALTFTFLDPQSLRDILKALPGAPLTEHYSIEPLQGKGLGPFYGYDAYAYTSAVDQYLRTTGDKTLLNERVSGKTILDWLITLATWGERDKDPDGNDLLDYGNDSNLLELKKTGDGPGYLNEVPSPNGERVYVYLTVADLMESADPDTYREKIIHFRDMAGRVSKALNDVLWLDKEGWYGTRQRDGSVIPVDTVQVFELLRFPGLVSRERASRLVAHLNDSEFVGQWGIRSMSIKDRLYDYNDHDWAGAMSYVGTGPELSADLFSAGFPDQGWMALQKILWWPDHLAVYPQGIANDDYTFRYPQAAQFGGRIGGGRSNAMVSCAGVEAVLRGVFGLDLGRDGSIGVSNNQLSVSGSSALAIPFRGRIWTVTQTYDGLSLRSNEGFEASFFEHDGFVRVKVSDTRITVGMKSRAVHTGRLSVSLGYLAHVLGVQRPKQLRFSMNGVRVWPQYVAGKAVFATQTDADAEEELEITNGDSH